MGSVQKKTWLSWTMSSLIAALTAPQAYAQKAAEPVTLEEIIVTAQKRSENLQDVPIAVQAFSAETLASANVAGLTDLVNVTPSLRFTFAAQSGSLFLRGVGNDATFPGTESEVQLYIDNVYFGSSANNYMKFNNIDRVEVDKGPQGTLFGRNATGGVIQVFTRDPSHTTKVDASAGFGNFNSKEADLYATTGLSETLAADVAVHFNDHDGWGRNPTLGSDAYSERNFSIRSKWLYEPSSTTKVTLIGNYSNDHSDLGTALTVASNGWHVAPTVPPTVFQGYFTPQGDAPGQQSKVRSYGGSVKIDQALGDLSFVSITGGQVTKSTAVLDGDASPAPNLVANDLRNEKQASQEFQLLSPTTGRLRWILGTYLYYNKASEGPAALSGNGFAFLGAAPVFPFLPNPFVTGVTVASFDNYSAMTTKSIAGFGQATYDVTPSTHVTGGLRYTYDRRSQEASTLFHLSNGTTLPLPPANDYPNASFNALTGKITLSQDLSDNVMAYAGYSRGYKAGTFNNLVVLSNPGPALNPEHIDAYEVGLKNDLLDHRLRLNLSAFYYKYTDLQVTVFQTINTALQNAGSANIKGFEGDAQLAVTGTTQLSGGFSWLDAKYKEFDDSPLYTPIGLNTFNAANFGFGGFAISSLPGGADGNTLPQAPKFSGYFGVNQRVEMGSSGNLNLNATLTYQSRVYFTPDNLFSERPFTTVAASAKWTAPNEKWDVTLWGRNLTDVKSWRAESVSGYVNAGIPNEPRSFGARVGVHF